MAKYKMILDLDTGIDDALAIAYALATPETDLIGIIGSYGNVVTSRGVQNSLDLLELLGHPEVLCTWAQIIPQPQTILT